MEGTSGKMKSGIRKALVTGGCGFIGSHIAEALNACGCEVVVLDNLSTGKRLNLKHISSDVELVEGDIREPEHVERAVKGCDVVFHQAAVVSVPKTVAHPVESAVVNELGTLNVLEAARLNKIRRVVMASSCAVYGDDPQLPKHEGLMTNPLSPYAVQKLFGEHYARIYSQLYGVETACLRYFNVFGPRQDPSSPYSGVISIFFKKAMLKQKPVIYGDGNQCRDFIFVKDVVTANLLAAQAEGISGCRFNIGTGQPVRINTLWEHISRLACCSVTPEYAAVRAGDIRQSVADISLARSGLGFDFNYSLEDGLEMTYDWFDKCPEGLCG